MRQWTLLESVVCQCKPLNVRNVALRGRDYQHVDGVTRATDLERQFGGLGIGSYFSINRRKLHSSPAEP
jgi:hypothetical protein